MSAQTVMKSIPSNIEAIVTSVGACVALYKITAAHEALLQSVDVTLVTVFA